MVVGRHARKKTKEERKKKEEERRVYWLQARIGALSPSPVRHFCFHHCAPQHSENSSVTDVLLGGSTPSGPPKPCLSPVPNANRKNQMLQ